MIKRIVKRIYGNFNPESHLEYCIRMGAVVGKNFNTSTPDVIDYNWPWLVTIGDNVSISTNVKILAHDASTKRAGVHTKIGTVVIGDNVWIGSGTIVMCNTRIGNNVVIGAGSIVNRDLPDNTVCAGNPCRVIGTLEEFKKKHQDNQSTHPIFRQHKWDEWKNASMEERIAMKEALKDTYGYL